MGIAVLLFLCLNASAASSPIERKWEQLPVKLCPHSEIPSQHRAALVAAGEVWNQAFQKKLFDLQCESKVLLKDVEQLDTHSVFWVKQGFEKFTEKTSVARTIRADQIDGKIRDADVLINAQYFDWDDGRIDLKTVMVHELGHVLGLDHNFIDRQSVMNYFPYQAGVKIEKFGPTEKLLIERNYFGAKKELPAYLKAYFKGDTQTALALLSKQPKRTDDEEFALALLEKKQKKYAEAVSRLKLLAPKTLDPRVYYELGDCLWALKKDDEAYEAFKGALRLNPKYYEAWANLGGISFGKKNYENAKVAFETALKINPNHHVACLYLFQITSEQRYQDCVRKYE